MSLAAQPKSSIARSQPTDLAPLRDFGVMGAFVLTFLVVFVNSADFQGADPDSFSVNYQVYLRIFVCGLCGLFGIAYIQHTFALYLAFPGILVVGYGLMAILSIPFSIDWKFSLVSVACLWSLFLFLPAALAKLGNRKFLIAMTIGAVSYVGVSWFLYFVIPEIGVSREFITNEDYLERMGGLGHPNTLGFYASASLLLVCIFYRQKMLPLLIVLAWTVVCVGTLYFCLSRTSIILGLVGLTGIFLDRIFQKDSLLLLSAIGMAMVMGLLAMSAMGELETSFDRMLRSVSKSGETSELTSGTGRSEIWEYAVRQIGERPLNGYGYATQRFVMEEHSYHSHNIVINAMLGCGVFAGMAVAGLLGILLYRLLFTPKDLFMRAFIPLFLIGGIVESMIYSPAPSLEMVLFFALVFWIAEPTEPETTMESAGAIAQKRFKPETIQDRKIETER